MPKSARHLIHTRRPPFTSAAAISRTARRIDPLVKKAAAETAGIVSVAAVMLLALDCLFNGGLLR